MTFTYKRSIPFLALIFGGAICACSSSNGGTAGGGGATSDLCSKYNAYVAQCNKTDACTMAIEQNCSTYFGNYSSAYLGAADACVVAPYDCSDGGKPAASTCVAQQLSSATPTAAQAKVKADFCAQCPDGASKSNPMSCSQFFQVSPSDGGISGGPGIVVLIANDAIATQIDQKCTGGQVQTDGGTSDCVFSFAFCSALVLGADSNTPQACNKMQSVRVPFVLE